MTEPNGQQALALRQQTDIAPRAHFDDATVELIRKTVSDPRNPLTQDEFSLFIAVCQRLGANPLLREAYALKDRGGRFSIAIGIDKYRQMSQENPRFMGQAGPYWAGKDGVWRDVWTEDTAPAAAKVGIWLRGAKEPTWGVATYKGAYRNTPNWNDNPAHMLALAAERHAHRKCSSRLSSNVVLMEDEVDQIPRDEPDPGPSPRMAALRAEMDAAVAEGEISPIDPDLPERQRQAILMNPAIEPDDIPFEQEQSAEQTGELPGPRWGSLPIGRSVSAMVDALNNLPDGDPRRRFVLPADSATDDEVRRWLDSKKRLLESARAQR